jgi:glycerate 2-kinase
MEDLKKDCLFILGQAIHAMLPEVAVKELLNNRPISGRVTIFAIGKGAWRMADAALSVLGDKVKGGIVITKYGHAKGPLPGLLVREAGHPIPDLHSYEAAGEALNLADALDKRDTALLLISGGGSSLFELPLIEARELRDVTDKLLKSGADIREINCIRKRLSAVKGGRFALRCAPARVITVILSDIVGDPVDMIASGPACVDLSTTDMALDVIQKYHIPLSNQARTTLRRPLPDRLDQVETHVIGSVGGLCKAAQTACATLGYEPVLLTTSLDCQACEAGRFLAAVAREHQPSTRSLAFIAGGETVVHVHGNGLGGRNQELALAAAKGIAACRETAVFSVGSDGTDGPTDAAGGYVDENTYPSLLKLGVAPQGVLEKNDAYHGLKQVDGLLMTGPTGTNVNDLSVALIRREPTGTGRNDI